MNEQQMLGLMIKGAIGGDPEKSKEVSAIISDNLKENCDTIGIPIGSISDGYHTFDELYAHRIALFRIAGIYAQEHAGEYNYFEGEMEPTWKSKLHSDGSLIDGWFIAGILKEKGRQITYHIPISEWDRFNMFKTIDKAPEWDGHTSADVLKRLEEL